MMTKKLRKAIGSAPALNAMYRLIPKSKRECFTCYAQLFGYSRADIQNILENERQSQNEPARQNKGADQSA